MFINIFEGSVSLQNVAFAVDLANFCEMDLIEAMKEAEDFHKDMEYMDSLYPF